MKNKKIISYCKYKKSNNFTIKKYKNNWEYKSLFVIFLVESLCRKEDFVDKNSNITITKEEMNKICWIILKQSFKELFECCVEENIDYDNECAIEEVFNLDKFLTLFCDMKIKIDIQKLGNDNYDISLRY